MAAEGQNRRATDQRDPLQEALELLRRAMGETTTGRPKDACDHIDEVEAAYLRKFGVSKIRAWRKAGVLTNVGDERAVRYSRAEVMAAKAPTRKSKTKTADQRVAEILKRGR
jgi:hypothetical protein